MFEDIVDEKNRPTVKEIVIADVVMELIEAGDPDTAAQVCRDADDPCRLAFAIACLAGREPVEEDEEEDYEAL